MWKDNQHRTTLGLASDSRIFHKRLASFDTLQKDGFVPAGSNCNGVKQKSGRLLIHTFDSK